MTSPALTLIPRLRRNRATLTRTVESDVPIRHRFTRDAVGRLLRKATDDGITDYAYDTADNLLAITFKAHNGEQQQLKFRYDALGQLLSETCDAGELKYDYDALGNLQTLTLPDQRQLNHLYYGSGHLHQLNLNGRVISDFERDPLHDEVLRTQGSLLTRIRYDRSGRLSQKALHYRNAAREELPLLQKRYQYDASDNLIIERLTQTQRRGGSDPRQPLPDDGQLGRFLGQSHGKSVEGNEHYSYDATERLRDHRQSNLRNPELHRETYNYDAAANLLPTGRMGGYVKHNRVHVFEDKRYRYDRFGRLSEKRIGSHTVQRFRYDAEQRLICVEQDQGWQRLRSEYRYDPLGRRIGKRVYRNDNEQPQSDVQFVWQGLRLLQEVEHGFGSLYVYANPDSYEPLARIDGRPGSEEIFYFHTNLAGLPEQLTDEAGLSVWHSEYEGWGKSRDEWHDQRVRREQNLRFQGQYLDRETGLHYNTFRFYDPEVGRFTQPDPIGLMGGLNFYCYSPNPLTWTDPLGLDWNYILRDSHGSPYYHGRASDKATLTDVARRHSKTKGIDGARFGPGDTINQITPKGTDRTIARGIEDIGSREKNVLGRKTGKVRGNVDPGISDSNPKRHAYLAQAKAYLQSKGIIKPSLFSPIESKLHTSQKKSPTPTICGKK